MFDQTKINLFNIAYDVRLAVEKFANSQPDEYSFNLDIDPEDLSGGCAAASYALWKVLKKFGHNPIFICAGPWWHCWVENEKFVIDITATQFSETAPKVLITPIAECEYYKRNGEFNRFYRNSTALRIVNRWDGLQAPKNSYKKIIGLMATLCEKQLD